MKVFISWSGDTSQKLAQALRDWLPSVLQCVEPYVSSEDIDKGARWSTDIATELSGSSFGILCVTRDNVGAPWLNFEAGALSKTFDKSRVCPFLFGMKRAELRGPLLQFQSTIYEVEELRKLIRSVNAAAGDDCLDEVRVDRAFEVWWPRLREALDPLESLPLVAHEPESTAASHLSDMIEEILELSRGQQKVLSDPRVLLPPDYLEFAFRHSAALPRHHPAWRELELLVPRAEKILAEIGGKNPISITELLELIREFTRTGSYLLHRNLGRRPVRFPDRSLDEGK